MKQYDERQELKINSSSRRAFELMFFATAIVIVIEMLLFKGDIKMVAGETVILLAGGIGYLAQTIRAGIWTKRPATAGKNLVLSLCLGVVFAVVIALIFYRKNPTAKLAGMDAWLVLALGCFVLFTLLGMGILTILGKTAKKKEKELENEYMD